MKPLAAAAAFAAAFVAASAAAAAPGEGFDSLHYEVRLAPDHAARSIEGATSLELRVTAPSLAALEFSPNALSIRSATLNGRPVRVEQQADALVVVPERPLRRGERARLVVRYRASAPRGIAFGPDWAYSNWFACDWMVCALDEPGDKATIALDLVVSAGRTTLGPGRLVSRRPDGNGREVHRWRSRRAYSSYLYSFAAGRFAHARRLEGRVALDLFSLSASPERLERLFAPTAAMLRYFEEKAGVRFPHRRYAQLHVPGSAAQETVSFALVGEQEIAPIEGEPQEDWVIAHELAHQYWGNLVTCADWSQFWLNEGVATFMVAAWKEHRWGRAVYDRELELARRRVARAAEAGIDVPLTFAGPYPSLALRRAITYSKGALFLDALRTELGDETFWRALRRFTRRHSGGTVNSRDFQRAFEESAGRDLGAIFARWVY